MDGLLQGEFVHLNGLRSVRVAMRAILLQCASTDAFVTSQCMTEADHPKKCVDYMEDYFECLHHRKEVSRHAHRDASHPSLFLSPRFLTPAYERASQPRCHRLTNPRLTRAPFLLLSLCAHAPRSGGITRLPPSTRSSRTRRRRRSRARGSPASLGAAAGESDARSHARALARCVNL